VECGFQPLRRDIVGALQVDLEIGVVIGDGEGDKRQCGKCPEGDFPGPSRLMVNGIRLKGVPGKRSGGLALRAASAVATGRLGFEQCDVGAAIERLPVEIGGDRSGAGADARSNLEIEGHARGAQLR
jgi:hypothetical protein